MYIQILENCFKKEWKLTVRIGCVVSYLSSIVNVYPSFNIHKIRNERWNFAFHNGGVPFNHVLIFSFRHVKLGDNCRSKGRREKVGMLWLVSDDYLNSLGSGVNRALTKCRASSECKIGNSFPKNSKKRPKFPK